MDFTVLRRSERIRNMNVPTNKPILPQMKREGARMSGARMSGARMSGARMSRTTMSVRMSVGKDVRGQDVRGKDVCLSSAQEEDNIQRHKQQTSLFSKLPDMLVMEILSRLPPKPFFRCKSVCKTWLSVSSDAFHLNKHLQPNMRCFFYNHAYGEGGAGFVKVDGTVSVLSCHNQYLQILDCCNGLLLVEARDKKSRFLYDLHVYNPVTRTLFTLWSHILDDQAFSLAFDPRVLYQFHVIRFKGNFFDISLFKRGTCKHYKKLASPVIINYGSKGTFVDGRVHRLTIEDEILSVDMNNCSYQVIRPPNLENRTLIEIGQSQGVLHCMSICEKKMLLNWVLESYTRQQWTLKYQLSLDTVCPVPMPSSYHFCIDRIRYSRHFAFHPEKDVVFMPVGDKYIVSADLSTHQADVLDCLINDGKQYCWIYMPCYLV